MDHVVQFSTLSDFIADVLDGHTPVIYYQLIEQRTASSNHGISRWLLTSVIRAFVTVDGISHTAALTFAHGQQVDQFNGSPIPGVDNQARWQAANERHMLIVDELQNRLYEQAGSKSGLISRVRAGIVHVPADSVLILATFPLDEYVLPKQEAPAQPD
jgi:hypothetical protein